MANTTLTQTGAQVQAILDKADELPASLGTAGQVLKVNSGGTGLEWANESGGSSIPTVTITQSQVVSQNPTQIQLTDEQYQIVANNKQVLFDGTALGVDSVIINYTGSSSNGSVNYIIFGYSTSSTNRSRDFYQILIDTSTKIGEFRDTTINVTSIDVDGAGSSPGKVATSRGDDVFWEYPYRMSYLTTAPTSANTTGTVEIVVLSSEPAQRYSGYLYIITGSN